MKNRVGSLMIVVESPTAEEIKKGRMFVGKVGQEMDNLIHRFLKIPRPSIHFTSLFRHELNEDKEYTEGEWEYACMCLEEEIKEVGPSVIIAMGYLTCKFFIPWFPDMESISGEIHIRNEIPVIPCFHPSISFHSPLIFHMIIEALKVARSTLEEGIYSLSPPTVPVIQPVSIERVKGTCKNGIIGVDTETLDDVSNPTPYMIQVASKENEAAYIYVDDRKGVADIKSLIEHPNITSLIHNSMFDIKVLEKSGIKVTQFVDTMVESFLHQILPLGLKALAYKLGRWRMKTYEEVVGMWPDLSWVDEDERVQYACADPCATLMVHRIMGNIHPRVEPDVLKRDMDVIPMLLLMMKRGMKVEKETLERLEAELSVRNLETLDSMITRWPVVQKFAKTKTTKKCGTVRVEDFNPGSDKQLAQLLYGELGLGNGIKVKKSKWGGSVNKNHLIRMEEKHPIVPLIQDWRETATLIDDFIVSLPSHIREDGRIHTDISMVRVKHSGRLASSNPNLMNQPTRTEDGGRIREAFIPEEGYSIWSFDYNQIEMRLMAHLSQDPVMCESYRKGLVDIHTETAMRIFGIPNVEDVDEMMHRYPSKRTGFGIINNISAQGLARELVDGGAGKWTEDRCEEMIKSWFGVYKGVKNFMMNVKGEARRNGCVVDMWGRMEYIAGVYSAFNQQQEKGLRVAINQKIQSGAQGIIKEAMARFHREGWLEKWWKEGVCYPLIQIHDDLVWEIKKGKEKEVVPTIVHIMENTVTLSIPITVGAKKSDINWGKLEKVKKIIKEGEKK